MDDVNEVLEEARREMHAPRQSLPEYHKMKLHGVVQRLHKLIARDRTRVLEQLGLEMKNTVEGVDEGRLDNQFLPMPGEELAQRLWDGWTEEERAGITVEAGYCILDHKTWFRVAGVPELVEEPQWAYLVDPAPTGVVVYDQVYEPMPRIMIVEPMASMSRIFSPVNGTIRPKPPESAVVIELHGTQTT